MRFNKVGLVGLATALALGLSACGGDKPAEGSKPSGNENQAVYKKFDVFQMRQPGKFLFTQLRLVRDNNSSVPNTFHNFIRRSAFVTNHTRTTLHFCPIDVPRIQSVTI